MTPCLIVAYLVGVIFGCIATQFVLRSKHVGTLYFYYPDQNEPPIMTAELDEKIENICKRKHVTFTVSQK